MQLVIVTGLSGSGKTVALRVFEDTGYYCIDNLPVSLLPYIQSQTVSQQTNKIAISIDSRSIALDTLPFILEGLKQKKIQVQVLYLDASQESLMKRFSETRRKHPLSNPERTLAESIAQEREMLSVLGTLGHHIDTSSLTANALRQQIREWMAYVEHSKLGESTPMMITLVSFGFKHGLPLDADFVFDVRSLPNPHYDVALRPYNGQQALIKTFMQQQPAVLEMQNDIQSYIEKWLPSFYYDHRSYLTVALGCTGGQHRSVYLVEQLSLHFKQQHQVMVRHRDMQVLV